MGDLGRPKEGTTTQDSTTNTQGSVVGKQPQALPSKGDTKTDSTPTSQIEMIKVATESEVSSEVESGDQFDDETVIKDINETSDKDPKTTKKEMEELSAGLGALSVKSEKKEVKNITETSDRDPKTTKKEMEELSAGLGALSVESEKKEVKTARSIIERIERLERSYYEREKLKADRLTAHGPRGRACAFYKENQTQLDPLQPRIGTKRGAGGAEKNACKFIREKGPSEQDERLGQVLPEIEQDTQFLINWLHQLTEDPRQQTTLFEDIRDLGMDEKRKFSQYVECKMNNQTIVPPNSYTLPQNFSPPRALMATSQIVPGYECQPSPSSGYFSNDDDLSQRGIFSPGPTLSPASPARSDTTAEYSENGNSVLPQELPEELEHFSHISPQWSPEYCTPQEFKTDTIHSPPHKQEVPQPLQQQFVQPQLHNPPDNDITRKQMMQMKQVVVVQSLPGQQSEEKPWQLGSGVMHPQFPAQMIPVPSLKTQMVPATPAKNCGCGLPNCGHPKIAPKLPYAIPSVVANCVGRPSTTKVDDIVNRLDRQEMVGARRWVASIKTEELMKSDHEGDLALHILVVQTDRPKLIAILERCDRENITEEVINKQNIYTQTLLFLAVLASPPSVAADMVSILLENNANPLISTMSTKGSMTDSQYRFPIHIVAQKGNTAIPIMTELLSKNREEQLRICCDSEQTALHYAALAHRARSGDPSDQMILYLLEHGADINAQEGKRGRTPLHYMVETRDVALLTSVFHSIGPHRARQAINLQTYDGCTSLHIAAGLRMDVNKHKALLKLLVDFGADITVKNKQNQRAADLIPHENRELLGLLKGGSVL